MGRAVALYTISHWQNFIMRKFTVNCLIDGNKDKGFKVSESVLRFSVWSTICSNGRKPWSSGNGRRLSLRSRVFESQHCILGGLFTLICCKKFNVEK